jgi:hypothetical protein
MGGQKVKDGKLPLKIEGYGNIGVWQGVTMDFLKYHYSPPCPTVLCLAGGPPLKQPYGLSKDGLPTGQAACGRLLPFWTPHTMRL